MMAKPALTVVVEMQRQQDAEEERRLSQALALQAYRRVHSKRKTSKVRSLFTSCFQPTSTAVDCDLDGPGRVVQTLPGGQLPTFVRPPTTSSRRVSLSRAPSTTAAARPPQRAGNGGRAYRSPPRSSKKRAAQPANASKAPAPTARILSKQVIYAKIVHMTPGALSSSSPLTAYRRTSFSLLASNSSPGASSVSSGLSERARGRSRTFSRASSSSIDAAAAPDSNIQQVARSQAALHASALAQAAMKHVSAAATEAGAVPASTPSVAVHNVPGAATGIAPPVAPASKHIEAAVKEAAGAGAPPADDDVAAACPADVIAEAAVLPPPPVDAPAIALGDEAAAPAAAPEEMQTAAVIAPAKLPEEQGGDDEESVEVDCFSRSSERLSSGSTSSEELVALALASSLYSPEPLKVPAPTPAKAKSWRSTGDTGLARSNDAAGAADGMDGKQRSVGHPAAGIAATVRDLSMADGAVQHVPDALGCKEHYRGPEHSASSVTGMVIGHFTSDLSARSMPLLSGKEEHAGSSADGTTNWKQALGGPALQHLAQRVEELLSRSKGGEANQPASTRGMVSPFLRSSLQSEASLAELEHPVGAIAGAAQPWFVDSNASPLAPITPQDSDVAASMMGSRAMSPLAVLPLSFAGQRSYSCASDNSPYVLTHASSAAVDYLPSDEDADEQPVTALAATPGPQAAMDLVTAEPSRPPQWGRAVSFALSIHSDDVSALSDSTATDLASEQQQLDEVDVLAAAVEEEQQQRQQLAADVAAVQQRSQGLPRAVSFAISISSDGDSMSTVSDAVIEQIRTANPQHASSFAISVSSYSDAKSAFSDAAPEAETDKPAAAVDAQTVQLRRAVSFAISVSSDSDAQSAVSDAVAAGALPVARAEEPAQQQEQHLAVLARATSFAISVSSYEDADSAVSDSAALADVEEAVDAEAQARARRLGRAVSFAISVSSSSDSDSFCGLAVGAEAEQQEPQQLAEDTFAGDNNSHARAGGARVFNKLTSFALHIGSDASSASEAGSEAGARARALSRAKSFALNVGSDLTDSGAEGSNDAAKPQERRLGRLTSFAVLVGSEVSSSEGERSAGNRRQLDKLTSFALDIGSEASSASDAGSQAGAKASAKSFALNIGSDCASSDSDREAARV